MRLIYVTALALPLTVSSTAGNVGTISPTCAEPGWSLATEAYFHERNENLSTPEQCGEHCIEDNKCASYAVGNKICMHFTAAVTNTCKKDTQSPFKFYDRTCAGVMSITTTARSPTSTSQLCQVRGFSKNNPKPFVQSNKSKGFKACSALCRKTTGCKSLATSNDECLLYRSIVSSNFISAPRSPFTFWDASCLPKSTCTRSSIMSATRSSSATGIRQTSSSGSTRPSIAISVSTALTASSAVLQQSTMSPPVSFQNIQTSSTIPPRSVLSTITSVSGINHLSSSPVASSTPPFSTPTSHSTPTQSSAQFSSLISVSSSAPMSSSTSISSSKSISPPTSITSLIPSLTSISSSALLSSSAPIPFSTLVSTSTVVSSTTPISSSAPLTSSVVETSSVKPSSTTSLIDTSVSSSIWPPLLSSSSASSLNSLTSATRGITPSSSSQFVLTTLSTRTSVTSSSLLSSATPAIQSSSSVATPSVPADFTRTYSFEDYTLPSVSVMGTSPATDGLSGPTNLPPLPSPCVLDASTGEASKFKLLSPSGLPIVSRGSSIGPFPSPSSEAEANALGPADDLVLSTYYFSKPDSAPDNVYDLVLAGSSPKFVAKVSDGSVILTDSSTGAEEVTRDGLMVVTSIFSLDCKGRIAVADASGQSFTWELSGSATRMSAGSSNQKMLALPVATTPSNRRLRRQSQASSGVAPRCPNTPANLFSKTKDGATPNINGCGTNNGFDNPPPSEYNFEGCCNNQDACYDNCEQTTFEQCNTNFQSCMKDQSCASLNQWTTYDSYLACTQLADYTYSVVSSDSGRQAFYDESNRQCSCFCSNTQGLCLQTDSSYQCTDLFATDKNNCGACGRMCPDKTRCSGGSCVCAHDQCGDECVDFQTHPSNCGGCGNVCSSGYCYLGSCYTPPPSSTVCTPGEGFANGQFLNDFSGWTTSRAVPAAAGVVPIGRAADTAAADGFDMYFNPTAVYQTASTEVRVCAGQNYELTFQLRTENDQFGSCNIWITIAGTRQIYQDTTRPASSIMRSVGPFNVGSFTSSTPSVQSSGADLYVPFQVVLQCQGQGGGAVRFDAFSLTPYTP